MRRILEIGVQIGSIPGSHCPWYHSVEYVYLCMHVSKCIIMAWSSA